MLLLCTTNKMDLKPSKSKPSRQNPNPNPKSNRKRKLLSESEKEKKRRVGHGTVEERGGNGETSEVLPVSASEQLKCFLDHFQSANGVKLSSLELESISDTRILKLSQCPDHVTESVGKDMKAAFGPLWKKVLCEKQLLEGKVDAGSPAILIISASALRSLELLRGLRSFTKECDAVKLFSKHIKVEEQVSLLKSRVNIASGTPSRIKKLIDVEALGLSRLAVILLDVRPDVKGYSLFTLPQVRDEFWDLYKNYFHKRLVEGTLRLALYGSIPNGNVFKGKKKA